MKTSSIIFPVFLIFFEFCYAYDYPKPELKFDCEDTTSSPTKPKVLRRVFFYTYDDNYDGREVEMHELKLESFNKLVSSSDFIKSPAALKSTFNFIEFFNGRCQASINCERILQECPSISPCRKIKSTTPKPSIATSTKPQTTSTTRITTTPEPPPNEVEQKISKLFLNVAPQLTEPHLNEIMTALRKMGKYSQNWTPYQNKEITTRSSLINQREMLKQNTSVNAVIKFSDDIKQHIINYTREFDPDMSLDDILGMIDVVEEIGTATMRYLTVEQFVTLNRQVVSELVNDTVTHEPTEVALTSTTLKATSTTKRSTTTTLKPPTTTKRPQTTTKTYVPPPGSLRKPYTRWVGQTYRQYTGQYSFGYTWKPYTGGRGSWRTRTFTDGTTTTTERYRQKGVQMSFDPVGNN